MANEAIDTSRSPFVSVRCIGCDTHVVAVPGAVDPMCMECRRDRCAIDWPWFEPIGEWHPSVGYCSPGQAWDRLATRFPARPIVARHDGLARLKPCVVVELPNEDIGEEL